MKTKIKILALSVFACIATSGDAFAVQATAPISANNGVIALQSCADGQVLKWEDDDTAWKCASDNNSGGGGGGQLTEEEVEDYVGGMLGGTETGISVAYQDSTNDIDFVVADMTVAGDSGSTGITPGDTLTVAGSGTVSTGMSGDTLTITGSAHTTPGGSNGEIQYRQNGTSFAGTSQLTYDGTNFSYTITSGDEFAASNTFKEVRNESGATIYKCAAVYVSGYDTSTNLPLVSVADSDDSNKMPAIGLLNEDLANNSNGFVISGGTVSGLDSSTSESWSEGGSLYVNTAGTSGSDDCGETLTSTRPTGASTRIQSMGFVTRVNPSQGRILVNNAGRTNDVPNIASGNIWVGNSSGIATSTSVSGDIAITNTGVVSVQANSVALSTDTTGNYVASATSNGGLALTGTEGGSLGIAYANVPDDTNDGATGDSIMVLDADDSNALKRITLAELDTLIDTDTNTQLTEEQVEDFVGGMLGGTETGIAVTYNDTDNDIDFAVADLTVAGDSGSTAMTPGDTLTVAGSGTVSTAMSGDTLTITGSAHTTNTNLSVEAVEDIVGGMLDGTETGVAVSYDDDGGANIDFVVADLTVAGDSGSTAMTPGDTLTVAGSGSVSTAMSGDTLTITGTDNNTTYSAGDGLDLSTTTFSTDLKSGSGLVITSTELDIDTDVIQARVSGTCSAGNSIRVIAANGTVTCEADTDTNTNQLTTFTLTGDSGSNQTIEQGSTFDIAGGTNATTVVGATDTVTINVDDAFVVNSGNDTMAGTLTAKGVTLSDGATGPGLVKILEDTDLGPNFTSITVGNMASDAAYTLPTALPDANKILQSTDAGVLSWVADTDTNTTYSAGDGLDISGTTFSTDLKSGSGLVITSTELNIDTAVIQARVSGTCSAGNSIREIAANGSVTCEADTDTNTNQLTTFTLTADSGSNQTIDQGSTFDIAGGTNATTVVGATDTVTINVDDAFLINSGDDTTSGTITAKGVTVTDGSTGPGLVKILEDTDNGTNYASFTVGTLSENTAYTLPTALPSGNRILQSTDAGVLSWVADTDTDTNTQLTEEEVEDFVGGMLGGTETGITVAYNDTDNDIDFAVADLTVAGDSGSTAMTPGDTLTLAGGTNISTSMSGDTLTITGSAHTTDTNLTEEEVEDFVGTMVSGGTETNIAVTYTDGGDGAGVLNFVVANAFLVNSGDDTMAGTLTAKGVTLSDGATGPGLFKILEDTDLGSNFTSITVGNMASDASYTLPTALPGGNRILQSTDAGVLSWVSDADTNTNQLTTFTLTGDSGSNQTIEQGSTFDIAGGTNATTVVGATDTVTINVDDAFLVNSGDDTTSGTITAKGVTVTDGSTGPGLVKILEDTDLGSNFTSFTVGNMASDAAYTLPTALPASNKVLQSTSGGVMSWVEQPGSVTAINNATANELVTIGSTTTELDAEANLTFDTDELKIDADDANDPELEFSLDDAAAIWTVGIDDSDNDYFKIDSGDSLTDDSDFEMDASGNVTTNGGVTTGCTVGNGDCGVTLTDNTADPSDPGTDKTMLHTKAGSLYVYHDGDTTPGSKVVVEDDAVYVMTSFEQAMGTGASWYMSMNASDSGGTSGSNEKMYSAETITITKLACATHSVLGASSGNGRTVFVEDNGSDDSNCSIAFTDGSTTQGTDECSTVITAGHSMQIHWDETGAALNVGASCWVYYKIGG